nr:hypothetical protein BaRGS_011790 [Batillaria attramentaria]
MRYQSFQETIMEEASSGEFSTGSDFDRLEDIDGPDQGTEWTIQEIQDYLDGKIPVEDVEELFNTTGKSSPSKHIST